MEGGATECFHAVSLEYSLPRSRCRGVHFDSRGWYCTRCSLCWTVFKHVDSRHHLIRERAQQQEHGGGLRGMVHVGFDLQRPGLFPDQTRSPKMIFVRTPRGEVVTNNCRCFRTCYVFINICRTYLIGARGLGGALLCLMPGRFGDDGECARGFRSAVCFRSYLVEERLY